MFIEKLINRTSVRNFTSEKMSQHDLDLLTKVINNSPTSINNQQFSAIIITNQELKEFIAKHNWNQNHIREAAAFIVFVADRTRIEYLIEQNQLQVSSSFKKHEMMREVVDATIAATYAMTGLISLGYGVTMVGGLLAFLEKLQTKLNLPPTAVPILGLSVGKPAKINPIKPKMNKVFINHYDVEKSLANQVAYDLSSRDYFFKLSGQSFITEQLNLVQNSKFKNIFEISGDKVEKAMRKSVNFFKNERDINGK